jgi:hypothetical protein
MSINYPISMGFTKISILTFYLRVFPHEIFRKLCYFMMGIVSSIVISISMGMAFACTPISNGWNMVQAPGHCINKAALQYAGSLLNICTDTIVLMMPMKYLWGESTS